MNSLDIEPISVKSLKEECIAQLENLILSGKLKIGERLPSERDLAIQLKVSRPVLHEAMIDLASKGLVNISPRRGTFINDYRMTGSFALLSSLINYHDGRLDVELRDSLLNMRLVLETEMTRLAALQASPEQIQQLRGHVQVERNSIHERAEILTGLDFHFHLLIALASQNLIYPMIMNSFKAVYTNLTGQFFIFLGHSSGLSDLFNSHDQMIDLIEQHKPGDAGQMMHDILMQGEKFLTGAERSV